MIRTFTVQTNDGKVLYWGSEFPSKICVLQGDRSDTLIIKNDVISVGELLCPPQSGITLKFDRPIQLVTGMIQGFLSEMG